MIVSGSVALLLVLVVGIFIVKGHLNTKDYNKYIKIARNYYDELNYDNAITYYKKAIEVKAKEVDPYLELATVYIEQGDMTNAMDILEIGFEKTKSAQIKLMINKILNGEFALENRELTIEEIETMSGNVKVNDDFIKMLSTFTYNKYERKYKETSKEKNDKNGIDVLYGQVGIICSFNDVVSNTINDDKIPNEITIKNIGVIFNNFSGGVSYTRLNELFRDKIKIVKDEQNEKNYVQISYRKCVFVIESDENGNITNSTGENKVTPPEQVPTESEYTQTGYVIDAVTGNGVSSSMSILQDEEEINVYETDNSGSYEWNLEEGSYKINIKAEGYVEDTFEFEVDETTITKDFTISTILVNGEIRIVLEWKDEPRDLDAHLMTQGVDNDCVWANETDAHDKEGELIASLDLDCRNGYGPETTTIHNTTGKFYYGVMDYNQTGLLAGCGATVKVYLPNKAPVTFDVPNEGEGIWWRVCNFEDGKLITVNEIGDEHPGSSRSVYKF
jgi:tetratricopeptide (TPR) repeat protein